MEELTIGSFRIGDENEISLMVDRVFDEFIGINYTYEGQQTFKNFIKSEELLKRYKSGNKILTCRIRNQIAGMIEVRDKNHISLFFVDSKYHNLGIGKKLLNEVLRNDLSEIDFITVNSSIYSENIYKKLGFKTVDALQEKDGIKFIPMKKYCKEVEVTI